MESSVKLGKHVEDPRGKGCLDRIGSLPDELLGHMLSFLPTRSAVRTSILSTRWRYIFTLTSCLSFDDALCFRGIGSRRHIDPDRKRSFEEFVYNVLELHQTSPIKIFSLVCKSNYDISDLNAWVSNAVQKRVQEIYYYVNLVTDVPDALVMCETLVTLKILSDGYYGFIEIPLLVWRLPNLKFLYLAHVKFADCESMQRLFSGCKLLEKLNLECCRGFESDTDTDTDTDTGDHVIISARLLKVLTIEDCTFEDGLFEIDAPNLAYLTYTGNTGVKIVPSWKYSRSLVKAELMFHYYAKLSDYSSLEYNREVFKAAAYNTTELRLLSDTVELLLTLADQEQMPDFHSLSRLHLGYIPYDSWKYVTDLLDKSPQLEMVTFVEGLHHCYSCRAPPPCEPLFPFSCHAQVIEVRDFCGHMGALLHLGHLLKNAKLLKKLIIHKCRFKKFEDELQISKDDLLMLPRASKDCYIELN
ncbi:F-box/LRR-repeat protein At4g14103-like isoform X1 [Silene latifolia]|uniref:F-box/LRR-repeat protein At4g14103-like isoform X1 n=2 Tax=Silene latifolia TaxID=37657 RepID=UPI003D780B28